MGRSFRLLILCLALAITVGAFARQSTEPAWPDVPAISQASGGMVPFWTRLKGQYVLEKHFTRRPSNPETHLSRMATPSWSRCVVKLGPRSTGDGRLLFLALFEYGEARETGHFVWGTYDPEQNRILERHHLPL